MKKKDVSNVPASKGYIVVDTKKCTGCMSCMMACSLAHEGVINPALSRIQIKKNVFGCFPKNDIEQYVCHQCEKPECMAVCPKDAIYIDEATGARIIDKEKCIGCKACIKACPYQPSRIAYDSVNKKALKCDLCQDTPYWDESGCHLACISACSIKAIQFTTEIPEQSEDGYHVNLRKSLHYARMNFPIDDEGIQPPKEAQAAAGLKITGAECARSFWDDPDTEKES